MTVGSIAPDTTSDDALWKSTHSSLNVGSIDRLDTWDEMKVLLKDMGFMDGEKNTQLLVEHQGDLEAVIAELLC